MPENEFTYKKDLTLTVHEYEMALRVNQNSDMEPYVKRFPEEMHTDIRKAPSATRQVYLDNKEIEDLIQIWESPDLSVDAKLKATFGGMGNP